MAKIILKRIALGSFAISCIFAPGLLYAPKLFGIQDKNKLSRSLNNLKEKKYIKIYDKGGKTYFEITKKGRKILLEFDYHDMTIKKPKKWDGMWRLVLFDVPERKKLQREKLRIKLKELGFYNFQDSAFIFPYSCRKEINLIKEFLFLRNDVDYLLVKNLDRETHLKKHFRIK